MLYLQKLIKTNMQGPNSLQPFNPEVQVSASHEVFLHNEKIELTQTALYNRQESIRQFGINGDIRAIISMPGDKNKGVKQFAVVDFGSPDTEGDPYIFANQDGPITFTGSTPDRYALVGLKHAPRDQLFAFAPILPGETTIGRNSEHHNFKLGLFPNEDNVEQISRQHVSVRLSSEGRITITDHSTNGTKVEVADTERDVSHQSDAIARPLGYVVLNESRAHDLGPPKKLDVLESAKAVFLSAEGTDYLLGNVPGLDTLLDLMKPEERQAFQAWQMEQAAVRVPGLWEVLEKSTKDSAGTYVIQEQLAEDFKKVLEAYGAHKEPPSEAAIEAGVAQAKKIVESDQATSVLKNEEFLDHSAVKRFMHDTKKVTVNFQEPMYIEPSLIRGAGGFDSWAGRGHNGWEDKSYTKANGQSVTGASINAITDYATRPTQLPKMEYLALSLILTKEGPIFYSSYGSHRTAAAKLRSEPLRFSSMQIFDAR